MSFIKTCLRLSLAACSLLITPAGNAADMLAFDTELSTLQAPLTLTTARNIQLDLIRDDTLSNQDLWARIRSGFAMDDRNSRLVRQHMNWYRKQPAYLARMSDRARRYLYYIVGEVERRGMPTEIALLPMIESAFNPVAESSASASGIWQFIPATGKNYGMEQNWWYDGRRDVINATRGALDYLQQLHDTFGDWELALAAYNWGEGAVKRAQARNRKRGKPQDYASLRLPKETRHYVPKLLAIRNIIKDPAALGLSLEAIPNQPYFTAVSTDKHIDVKLAAELAGISMDEFTALNPAHNRPVILQGNSDLILLPIGTVATFQNNLANYDKPLVSWQPYQLKEGDSLDRLAPRFGISVDTLRAANGLTRRAQPAQGQKLLVPINEDEPAADEEEPSDYQFAAFNMNLRPTLDQSVIRHKVRRGETLSHIARRYQVKITDLKRWNRGLRSVIRPGQSVKIIKHGKGGPFASSPYFKHST